jgi:hypothetical protein
MRGILKKQPNTGKIENIDKVGEGPMTTDFEVRCDHCEVSYPVGTKRCMYCGGRPGHKPMFARQVGFDPLGEIEVLNDPFEPDVPPIRRSESPLESIEEDEAEQQPRSSIFRLLGNMSWIILFAVLTLYRACTG